VLPGTKNSLNSIKNPLSICSQLEKRGEKMPRKPVDSVQEFRMTMGAFEREQLKDFKAVQMMKAAALPIGIAAVGVGIALAGLFFKRGIDMIPKEIGANEATRNDVNDAVQNTPSESAWTPDQFEGMSPYEIYSIVHEYLVDLRKASYEGWLAAGNPLQEGPAPDDSANFNSFNRANSMAIIYGVGGATIEPVFIEVSEEAAFNSEGEAEYSPFAYQCAIRETASRRRMVNQADVFSLTKIIAAVIPAAGDWTSERVSEAPAYLNDPLLWTAWARVNFPSNSSKMAGADSPISLSYYFPVVIKSLTYENHILDLYEQLLENPTEFGASAVSQSWWPPQPAINRQAVQIAEEATGTDYAGPQAPTAGDIDSDGVPDDEDAYPRDATRS
jgi:hypothetical protein